jgi:hypothetical protein
MPHNGAVPSRQRHCGSHPADRGLFAAAQRGALATATAELSWLLERGYSDNAALKLVGDRHALRERQRKAVLRAACADTARADRRRRAVTPAQLAGRALAIDGFNCVITVEAALAGGVVTIGRDGAHRDLASVHGSYRKVAETERAVAALAALVAECTVAQVRWLLDRPVSNSGRLRQIIADANRDAGAAWSAELVDNPDRELVALAARGWVAATSDAWILDACDGWVDLPAAIIARNVPDAWIVDLCTAPRNFVPTSGAQHADGCVARHPSRRWAHPTPSSRLALDALAIQIWSLTCGELY